MSYKGVSYKPNCVYNRDSVMARALIQICAIPNPSSLSTGTCPQSCASRIWEGTGRRSYCGRSPTRRRSIWPNSSPDRGIRITGMNGGVCTKGCARICTVFDRNFGQKRRRNDARRLGLSVLKYLVYPEIPFEKGLPMRPKDLRK